jgi:hypothetical protein
MLILSRGFSRYIAQFSTENKWYFVLVYFCLFNYFCCLTMRSVFKFIIEYHLFSKRRTWNVQTKYLIVMSFNMKKM